MLWVVICGLLFVVLVVALVVASGVYCFGGLVGWFPNCDFGGFVGLVYTDFAGFVGLAFCLVCDGCFLLVLWFVFWVWCGTICLLLGILGFSLFSIAC